MGAIRWVSCSTLLPDRFGGRQDGNLSQGDPATGCRCVFVRPRIGPGQVLKKSPLRSISFRHREVVRG